MLFRISSALSRMLSWEEEIWLTIFTSCRSFCVIMGGRGHPLDVLLKLTSGKLLTLFSGLFCVMYCCLWASLLGLFGSLCNVLRLHLSLFLLMGIYMVSSRGSVVFVKEILFLHTFLLLVWNTFPG